MNMPETVIPIAENEAVKNIMLLLQGKGTEQEKQDVESLVKHMEYMETQFGKVFNELQDVKSQLQVLQDRGIKATCTRLVDTVELKVTDAKNQFNLVKENVINTFAGAVVFVK